MSALTGLAVIGVVAVILAFATMAGIARAKVRRYGLLIIVWRWISGNAHHGKPITDAGWFRPGKKALTRTGHATRFWYMPRWQRMLWRFTGSLGAFLAVYGMLVAPLVTEIGLAAASLCGAAYGGKRARQALKGRQHHRSWTEPLHVALAPLVGVPLPNRPESWLQIEPDRSKAIVQLPDGFGGDAKDKDKITSTVIAKLGLEDPDVQWSIAGPRPTLMLTASTPPPTSVTLDDVREAIDAARPDELVLGLGRERKVNKTSLAGDSPHIGLSQGSGAGKSTTARFLTSQVLYKGGVGIFLDIKRISHTWARGLPNVAYAKDEHEIHTMLLWLKGELDRRNEVADVAADIEGVVHANVGARLFVVAEELNMLQQRLRGYWKDVREKGDPTRSPAAEALDQLLFAGRQVRINVLMIGQRLSAAASGSGDARENVAVRILGRYQQSTWKMLCPEFPPIPSSRHPGRVQVVDDRVRENQVANPTGQEARDLALAGTVTPCPPGMPYVGTLAPVGARQIDHTDGQLVVDAEVVPEIGPSTTVSLREAVDQGLITCKIAAARKARQRDPRFPKPVAQRGVEHLFDADQLTAWELTRTGGN